MDNGKHSRKVSICFEKHKETYGNIWKQMEVRKGSKKRETREETSKQKEGRRDARSKIHQCDVKIPVN